LSSVHNCSLDPATLGSVQNPPLAGIQMPSFLLLNSFAIKIARTCAARTENAGTGEFKNDTYVSF
jgi:hypothetical protein